MDSLLKSSVVSVRRRIGGYGGGIHRSAAVRLRRQRSPGDVVPSPVVSQTTVSLPSNQRYYFHNLRHIKLPPPHHARKSISATVG